MGTRLMLLLVVFVCLSVTACFYLGVESAERYRTIALGALDSVFGHGTSEAVTPTLRGLGKREATPAKAGPPARSSARKANEDLLARLVRAVAEGEPYEGKVAVAAVVLNRIGDSRFPNTLEGVMYQPMAFEAVHDGRVYQAPPRAEDTRAARDALNGWDPTHGAVFFWNPEKPVSKWIWSRPIIKRIGSHVFAT